MQRSGHDRERTDDDWLDARLAATAHLDDLRAGEFARLDDQSHVYLDHTGAGLYPESLVRNHADLLLRSVLGNPHSDNPTSRPMTQMVDEARDAVLRFCSADPDDYECIFTPNASGAIRLVAEARGGKYLLNLDSRSITLEASTEITIARAPFTVQLVHLEGHDFMSTLRNKLIWGLDVRSGPPLMRPND